MKPISRRTFNASVAATIAGFYSGASLAEAQTTVEAVGPMVGHVSSTTAILWYRPATAGRFLLRAQTEKGKKFKSVARAMDENDRCVTWQLKGLKPATRYEYTIQSESKALLAGEN